MTAPLALELDMELRVTWEKTSDESGVYAQVGGSQVAPHDVHWDDIYPKSGSYWLVKVSAAPTTTRKTWLAKPVRELNPLTDVPPPETRTSIPIGTEITITWAATDNLTGVIARHQGNYLFPQRHKWQGLPRVGSQWVVKVMIKPQEKRNIYWVAPVRCLNGRSARYRPEQNAAPPHKPIRKDRAVVPIEDGTSMTVLFEKGDSGVIAKLPDGSTGFPCRHSWNGRPPQPGERWQVWPIAHVSSGQVTFLSCQPPRRVAHNTQA